MAELKASGLYREDKGGTKPRYHLQPAHEVSGCEGYTAPLTDLEQKLLNYLGFCYPTSLPMKASKEWDGISPHRKRPVLASVQFKPQHFLYFRPDPHGQGSLRPILRDGAAATGKSPPSCRKRQACRVSTQGGMRSGAVRVSSSA